MVTARTNGMQPRFSLQALRRYTVTRFQRKQYAPIDIVLTEKKGFGLRAAENLSRFVLLPASTAFLAFTCVFVSLTGTRLFMNTSGMSLVRLP